MRNPIIMKLITLLCSIALVVATIFIVPNQIKQLKNFKTNFVKTEVTVVDINKSYSSNNKSYTYSAICSYTTEDGKEYLLDSNVYTSKKPRVGSTKQVYVDPSNPEVYYNGASDIIIPLVALPFMCVLFITVSVAMVFKLR